MGRAAQALGLGVRGPAAVDRRAARGGRAGGRASGSASAASARAAGARSRRSSCGPPRLQRARLAGGDRQRRPPRARHRTRSARPTATSSAAFAAGSTTRPTSSPARATRPRSRRCSPGAPTRAPRRSRTAAAPASCGGIEPRIGDDYARRGDDRPRRRSTGCSRSTGSRARRGSRPGCSARRSTTSSREHGLTLRHFPQSFEFSTLGGWIATRAGGHFATVLDPHRRPGRVGARDHARRATGRAAGCRLRRRPEPRPDADRLRGHPRGDHRGLGPGPRAARPTSSRPRSPSTRSPPAPRRCGRSRSRASTRPTAGCSTRPRRSSPAPATAARRDARARLRVRAPAGRRAHGPGARAGPRSRRRARATVADGGGGRRSDAVGAWRDAFLAGALPARHPGRARRPLGHLRDGDHLGPVRGVPRDGDARPRARRAVRRAEARR